MKKIECGDGETIGSSALCVDFRGEEADLPVLRRQEIKQSELLGDQKEKLPKIYFDVRKFNVEDLIRILAECRKAELNQRISVFELKFDEDGNPLQKRDDGSYVKMRENIESEMDMQEISAMQRIRELSLLGYKTIAWFSPCGGRNRYIEDRITVAELKYVKDGSMVFECRGICTKHSRENFYRLVKTIADDKNNHPAGIINSPEDLREYPIALNPTEGQWFDYLAEIFSDIPEVFEAIATGRDIENMKYLRVVALAVKEEWERRNVRPVSYWEAIQEGAYLEQFISSNTDIKLMAGGGHGASNSSIFERVSSDARVVSENTPGAKYCIHCGVYYVGENCPLCDN